jgi:hypothetical protein
VATPGSTAATSRVATTSASAIVLLRRVR